MKLVFVLLACVTLLNVPLGRFGFIFTRDGFGSCVCIGKGYFLTATHVLGDSSFTVAFDGKQDSAAVVVWKEKDVVLVKTSIKTNLPMIRFKTPKIGDRLNYVQPGLFPRNELVALYKEAIAAFNFSDELLVSASFSPGVSGSGVFCGDKLVGVAHKGLVFLNGEEVGVVELIPDSLKDFIARLP